MEELRKKVNEAGQEAGEGTTATSTGNVDVAEYETKIKELTEQVKNSEEEVRKLKELDEQNKVRRDFYDAGIRFFFQGLPRCKNL